MKSCGITGKTLKWIEQFITNRSQTVVVNSHKSSPAQVISGVPQGTVLGPLLFLVYINDIKTYIDKASLTSFADDTRLSNGIKNNVDQKSLQDDRIYTCPIIICN